MTIDLNTELAPINPDEKKYENMLANLQGNILKSYGRNLAVYLFLTFKGSADDVRQWISTFSERYVTSALRQHHETQEYKLNNISGHLCANFYLSAKGYKAIGFNDLNGFGEYSEEDAENKTPKVLFKDGMKSQDSIATLHDPNFDTWEIGYRQESPAKEIHALVLLADDNRERLVDVVMRVRDSMTDLAEVIVEENGYMLRANSDKEDEPGKPIEHFGFRDGISQPLFYQSDVEKEIKQGREKWDPSAPLKLALIKDPFTDEEDCFGSYLVFRKLEQNVKKFKSLEKQLAVSLGLSDAESGRAGALIVGRFKNGVPVILSGSPDVGESTQLNNFNYNIDDPSLKDIHNRTHNKCPYHAHIRKTNPRGDTVRGLIDEPELNHRIVRRGITYGARESDDSNQPTLGDEPETGVGLLFVCFQANIPKQFGFIQSQWVNESMFPAIEGTGENPNRVIGLDPVIGQYPIDSTIGGQKWCPVWGDDAGEQVFDIRNVVKLIGGEFFFAPSISFLTGLRSQEPSDFTE